MDCRSRYVSRSSTGGSSACLIHDDSEIESEIGDEDRDWQADLSLSPCKDYTKVAIIRLLYPDENISYQEGLQRDKNVSILGIVYGTTIYKKPQECSEIA